MVTDEEVLWCSRAGTLCKIVAVFTFLLAGALALGFGVPAVMVSTQAPMGLMALLPVALFVGFIVAQGMLMRQAGKALSLVENPEERFLVNRALASCGTLFQIEGIAFWGIVALSSACVCLAGA